MNVSGREIGEIIGKIIEKLIGKSCFDLFLQLLFDVLMIQSVHPTDMFTEYSNVT